MNAINAYLDEVCHEISYRKIHPTIRQELACHIQDLREAYEAAGEKPEDALAHAIQEMGPAREVGQRLHQAHRPHTEWTILALVMLLIGAGAVSYTHLDVYKRQLLPSCKVNKRSHNSSGANINGHAIIISGMVACFHRNDFFILPYHSIAFAV